MRNNKLRWSLVAFLLAWSLWELNPPTGRDLLEVFKGEAVNTSGNFSNIVQKAEALREEDKKNNIQDRTYGNLLRATGTNQLKEFFTTYDVSKETDPNLYILNQLQKRAAGQIKLGLDLRGGSSFLMGMDKSALGTNANTEVALSQAVEVLRRRVDKLGVAEPLLQAAGEDRIVVQMPGVSEAERAQIKGILTNAAYLELRMVHPRSRELIDQGITEPGYEKKTMVMKRKNAAPETLLVKKKAERGFTGKYITQAFPSRNPVSNQPEILFRLSAEGADLFGKITTEHAGQRMAIVLDNEVVSAPSINEPIMGGSAQITGDFTQEEAFQLANALENPLEAPVKVLSESNVDPSLGKDSITRGLKASIYGSIGVAAFMVVFYMFAGAVANVALALNVLILMGVMCAIDATLTLPGIAGVALTIGMAVDANVLIFERIREELAQGKSLRGALAAGYDRAFGTILDSHVTTLITSFILIYLGTGPIKGFGVTLTIGVAASLFTALVVTRLIFDFMLDRDQLKTLKMLNLVKISNVDFMGMAKAAMIVSAALIVIGMGWGLKRGHDVLGADFAGGDSLILSFKEKVDVDKLRSTIADLKVGEPLIQFQQNLSSGEEKLQILVEYESGEKVAKTLQEKFPQAGFELKGLEKVGPSIGEEIQRSAVFSGMLAMLGILFYVAIRYEFSFAVGAIVAVLHDVLITMGLFFLSGGELSSPMVAAILTIIGYSINDKIVILDRIREDLKLGVRGSFRDVINLALNQTLSRTLITGGSVILATLALYVFGGDALNDFAFTFLVGILAGTYSSIFIASPVVLWWHKGERPKMGSAQSGVGVEKIVEAKA